MAQRVVIITGCSTGIGLDAAAFLAKNADKKFKVYACMRNLSKKDGLVKKAGDCVDKTLFILEMDVKLESSVNAAIKHVLDTDGRVDVLGKFRKVFLCKFHIMTFCVIKMLPSNQGMQCRTASIWTAYCKSNSWVLYECNIIHAL